MADEHEITSLREASTLLPQWFLLALELLLLIFFCNAAISVQPAIVKDSEVALQKQKLWSVQKAATILRRRVSVGLRDPAAGKVRSNVFPQEFRTVISTTEERVQMMLKDVEDVWVKNFKLIAQKSHPRRTQQPRSSLLRDMEDFFVEKDRDAEGDDVPGPPYVPPQDPFGNLSTADANVQRRLFVVNEFRDSWSAYVRYAWGSDELQPLSKTGKNWSKHGAVGMTIVDAATTMQLMGLQAQLDDATQYIENELNFEIDADLSQFELTIRIVGGLLSLFELTGETNGKLLAKAEDLAKRLTHVYDTPTGLPDTTVNLQRLNHSNPKWRRGSTAVAEIASVQLEFRTLSFHTKNSSYDNLATGAFFFVFKQLPHDFVPRILMNVSTGSWVVDYVTVGGLADSYFEYLLKQYLLTNRTQVTYKIAFKQVVRSLIQGLLSYSAPSKWAYFAQREKKKLVREWDHLACFFAGALALGARELDPAEAEFSQWMSLAEELTETCFQMYFRQKTGLSPDYVVFPDNADFVNGDPKNLLRPETMESLFYMWRFTKNTKYRDYGWRILRSMHQFCKMECGGYSGLRNVNILPVKHDDLMQSFWLAETLKYAFLLFSSDDVLDLDQWVLNTEGHPLRIRTYAPLGLARQNVVVPTKKPAHRTHRRRAERH